LGDVVGETRRRLGLSQEELAFQSGLHRTSISHIERGIKSPTVDTLGKIAAGLATTPSDLLVEAERRAKEKATKR
jgi:transcriptional regulator with XRE-family HTH domain